MKKKEDKFSMLDKIDFVVESRPISKEDNIRLTEIIANYKASQKKPKAKKKLSSKRKQAA